MASSTSPARPAWGPSYCTSRCCYPRRIKLEDPDGCACKECQPGDGIDFGSERWNKIQKRRTRLRVLLQREVLTQREQDELDELLHLYVLEH